MQSQPQPLSLSDDALGTLIQLARPLELEMRDPFLRAVASQLAGYKPDAIGPGLVSRIGRQLQREFFVAPAAGSLGIGKYR